jgi:hypothetical protein
MQTLGVECGVLHMSGYSTNFFDLFLSFCFYDLLAFVFDFGGQGLMLAKHAQ